MHNSCILFHQGKDNETIIFITYLPKKSDKNGECFAVSVSPAENVSLSDFRMQEQKALSIHKISHDELPASIKASTPPWFENYLIVFPYTKLEKFGVTVREKAGDARLFYFYKAPRYIVNKTGFQIM